MSKLLPFPDARRAREDASLWLARLDRGLTSEERAELKQWLRDSGNSKAFLEMGKVWRDMDIMSVLSELFPLSAESLNPAPRRRSFPAVALAATAAVCIVAIGAVFLAERSPWHYITGPSTPRMAVLSATYSTAVGESRVVTLGDGSSITLNTNTWITVVYTPKVREVFLRRGEANFEVAHEPQRAFNVYAGKRVLQAVGTAFNVRLLSEDNVELTVTEGKVRVLAEPPVVPAQETPDGPPLISIVPVETTVAAQEIAIVEPAVQTVRRLEPGELDARLAWQRGMLIFQGEPLELVLSEVDRYTNTEFVLADESLRHVRVGGYFRAGDVDGLLVALRENFRIESRRDAHNRIVLTAARPR